MADIFVSYRRDDSQWPAGLINERLEAVFGAARVFFDTVTIRPGEDFHQVLGDRVGSCRVLLAVIGSRWLDILEARLGEPNDFVRIEIAEGLQRKVRVIPVLSDGAKPPPAARLPDDLRALARLNAISVRANTFRSDLDRLIEFLRDYLDNGPVGGGVVASRQSQQVKPVPVGASMQVVTDTRPPPKGALLVSVPGCKLTKEYLQTDLKKPFMGDNRWWKLENYPGWSFDPATGIATVPMLPKHLRSRKGMAALLEQGLPVVGDPKTGDQGWGRGRRPVINVSWEDAKAYAAWLSQRTGKEYRLLSEAEWEYCCRAGTTTRYAFGNSITTSQAQFSEGRVGSAGRTAEVGEFQPNGWGLYDMHGNLWEWCANKWHGDYKGAPQDGSVWQGGDATYRVLRGGGCWNNNPQNLRSANRNRNNPTNRNRNVGFRVASTLIRRSRQDHGPAGRAQGGG